MNRVGTVTTTNFTDATGAQGTPYYYWARSINRFGKTGSLSAPDTGARSLTPPLTVTATDGAYTDRVQVSWSAAPGATGYQVFRSTANNGTTALLLGTATGTPYADTQASPGTLYYYWVAATNRLLTSRRSACTRGTGNCRRPRA